MKETVKKIVIDETIRVNASEEKLYNVIGVMFEVTKKRYYFQVEENSDYKKNDYVLVDTVRGQEIGLIYTEPMRLPESKLVLPLKPVLKKAAFKELKKYQSLRDEAKVAFDICKKKIIEHQLSMKLVEAEYTFDKTKLIFYFTSEGRVDFRELVKDLAVIFKLRIELRQIGVRDEARILGTIGMCGKELCCRTCINKFDSVSIKMARDQGIVINPSKISGICSRLLCCINYEYSQYEETLKEFPAVNQQVKTEHGDGKVISISPMSRYLFIDVVQKGIMKFNIDEIKFNKKEANQLKNIETKEEKQLEKELEGE
ncbi:PSP1 domain-containing protein [Fusobacterium sp. PH5-29]|uniref:PSP1 domain-containing protein n=1 Tax=Fusobacterium sp. PH5-29 TaxID=1742400 RepID=UPI003D22EC73